jgi:hypothetical protein
MAVALLRVGHWQSGAYDAPASSTRELMRRMGHASTRAAMIYQHTSDDRDRLIADTLGAAIDQWQHGQGDDDDDGLAGAPVPV